MCHRRLRLESTFHARCPGGPSETRHVRSFAPAAVRPRGLDRPQVRRDLGVAAAPLGQHRSPGPAARRAQRRPRPGGGVGAVGHHRPAVGHRQCRCRHRRDHAGGGDRAAPPRFRGRTGAGCRCGAGGAAGRPARPAGGSARGHAHAGLAGRGAGPGRVAVLHPGRGLPARAGPGHRLDRCARLARCRAAATQPERVVAAAVGELPVAGRPGLACAPGRRAGAGAAHPGLHRPPPRWRHRDPGARRFGYLGRLLRCPAGRFAGGDLDRRAGHVQCQSARGARCAPAQAAGLRRGPGDLHHRGQGAAPAFDQALPRRRRADGDPGHRAPGPARHPDRPQRGHRAGSEGDQPAQRRGAGVGGGHRHVAAGGLPGRGVRPVPQARPVGGHDRHLADQRHRVAGSEREPAGRKRAGRAGRRPGEDRPGQGDRAVRGHHPGRSWHALAAAQAVGGVLQLRPRTRAHDLAVVQRPEPDLRDRRG